MSQHKLCKSMFNTLHLCSRTFVLVPTIREYTRGVHVLWQVYRTACRSSRRQSADYFFCESAKFFAQNVRGECRFNIAEFCEICGKTWKTRNFSRPRNREFPGGQTVWFWPKLTSFVQFHRQRSRGKDVVVCANTFLLFYPCEGSLIGRLPLSGSPDVVKSLSSCKWGVLLVPPAWLYTTNCSVYYSGRSSDIWPTKTDPCPVKTKHDRSLCPV